jgi:hypothetical protein
MHGYGSSSHRHHDTGTVDLMRATLDVIRKHFADGQIQGMLESAAYRKMVAFLMRRCPSGVHAAGNRQLD